MRFTKHRYLLIITAAAGIILFGALLAGAAGTGDPGSANDPLVTKSYVEAQLNSFLTGKVNDTVKLYAEKNLQWQVADLASGQQLIGEAGTEFIVRVGQTAVVDPVGSGIPDVTSGVNVASGQPLALQHLFIIPRTDGRGIAARTKAVIMYKGTIQIK